MSEEKEFKINGTIIAPGENKQVILNTYELHTQTAIEIPIYVYRSKNPGPTILLSAGMHGDETNGIEIVRKIISRDEVKNIKCGSLIAIPVINIVSFLFGSRDLPDGRDMNRCFPGNKNGSLGSRIANDIMKQIIPLIDFGVDFHTGGAKINNYPQVRCVFDFPDNLAIAGMFSAPLIIDSVYRDGTMRKEAAKKGKPILVYEGGESLRFDYLAINEGVSGCLRLMKAHKMIDLEIPGNPSVKLTRNTWVRAKISGLFHFNKPNGSFVSRGDLLGVICNPYGGIEEKIVSPNDAYIVGVNNQPVINEGDALVHLGMEM
ncbi:MAG: succinylglutamate desuccinylase/aspartoacylase family protein [Bacteroidia bacterium]